eukprot:505374_1
MSDIRSKLKAERKRRKRLKNKSGKADIKYSSCDTDKANKLAIRHANKLNDQIDCSLDQSVKMNSDSVKTGADTSEMLDHQRNQIRNIHKNMHKTSEHLKDSDSSMQVVEHWIGGVVNVLREPRKAAAYLGLTSDKEKQIKNKKKYTDAKNNKEQRTHNGIVTSKQRKKKQKEKLKQIDNYLDVLYEQANEIGEEIEIQNEMIDECQHEMDDIQTNFKQKNTRLRKMLKNTK